MIVPVPADRVNDVWFLVADELLRVTQHTPCYEVEDILDQLVDEKLQLWVVLDEGDVAAVATTQVVKYPQTKDLIIVHCAGHHIENWAEALLEELTEYGQLNECTRIVTQGRKGTERLYPKWGFEFESVRMAKVI